MGLDVTVVVGTFGGRQWRELAEQRAVPSAGSFGVPVLHSHAETLHEARNGGLGLVTTEWVVFLDADDELERGYFDALGNGSADVRAPAVRYVNPGGAASSARVPQVPGHHDHNPCRGDCLPMGNWLVIGAAVRTELAREVGGFRDWPCYEDWCFWTRIYQTGRATFEAVPAAVYRAHVRRDSRNRGRDQAAKLAVHRAIAAANGVPIP